MRIIFITYFLAIGSYSYSIDFSTLNTSYWYQSNTEVRIKFNIAQSDDDLHIFIKVIADSVKANKVQFLLQNDFEDMAHSILDNPNIDTLYDSRNEVILKLNLQTSK